MTRLRELQHRGMHPEDYRTKLISDAADEIKRLQAEVAAWKNVACEITMYAAMQELKEAAGE